VAKRKQWRDPFADYIEWTQHRYDPGYYLGGRLPPHLKKSNLGPKGRRYAAIALATIGLIGLAGMIAVEVRQPIDGGMFVLSLFWPALSVAAGIAMWKSRGPQRGGSKTRP